MKKISYLLLTFIIGVCLTSCSINKEVTFKGESEHWFGTFVFSNSPKHDQIIGKWKIRYIGENKPESDKVIYKISG